MLTPILYSVCFLVATLWILLVQKKKFIINNQYFNLNPSVLTLFCIVGFLPVICVFGFRYGIGTDFFGYADTFNVLHSTPFSEYYHFHQLGEGEYYTEFGFYFLNRISPNYVALQFLIAIILAINLITALRMFSENLWMGIYIFFACHFVYATNGTRYAVGLSFLLIGYSYFVHGRYAKYMIFVLIASLFHKTYVLCLAFLFLKKYKNTLINKWVTKIEILIIMFSPICIPIMYRLASKLEILSRYYSKSLYEFQMVEGLSFKWLLHILPVMVILFFLQKNIWKDPVFSSMIRIFLLEFPFRFVGFYNQWYGRLARMPQVIEVLFIPYAISKMENKKNRNLFYLYYFMWYSFYLVYYWVQDMDIYKSIFF